MKIDREKLLGMSVLTLVAAMAMPAVTRAQPSGDRPPHHGPPPAAFDACKGKSADDACEVTLGDHTVQGTCAQTPDQRLACRPAPPPEAIDACAGKSDGDTCSVQAGPHQFQGSCRKGPGGGDKLACAPSR
jgi:hypothetical protein